MKSSRLVKIGRVCLGIATEIMMAIFIMAFALGLSWLISKS